MIPGCQEGNVKKLRSWSFLTNDALVLINVIEHPRSTLRRIADEVGISDRATLSILRSLERDAIVTRRREGRRNVYAVDLQALRNHRGQGPYTLEELSNALIMLTGRTPGESVPPALRQGSDASAAGLAIE